MDFYWVNFFCFSVNVRKFWKQKHNFFLVWRRRVKSLKEKFSSLNLMKENYELYLLWSEAKLEIIWHWESTYSFNNDELKNIFKISKLNINFKLNTLLFMKSGFLSVSTYKLTLAYTVRWFFLFIGFINRLPIFFHANVFRKLIY